VPSSSSKTAGLGIFSPTVQPALVSPQDCLLPSSTNDRRLIWRIGGLLLLLFVEVLAISSQAQHVAFKEAHGIAGLLYALGPWKIRLPITLAVAFLLFWQAKGRQNMQCVLAWPLTRGIEWRWLCVHLVTVSLFAFFSVNLLNNPPQGARLNGLIVLCLALCAAAAVSCSLGFLPAGLWREIFRGTGDAWAYVLVLGVGACGAAVVAERIWLPLARGTLLLAGVMLHPFVPGLISDPTARTLGTSRFTIEVAPACSGYEGIGLMLALTTAFLWFLRREWRFPRALLLIPIGMVAIWLCNAARIAGLVLIGAAGAPDIAMKGFHSHAGWIFFNVVALGSCVLARRVAWLSAAGQTTVSDSAERESSPVAAYLMPFLAILAAGLLAGAASGGFEWLYPLRIVAAGAALWYFRATYRRLDWHAGWPSLAAGAAVFVLWIGLERFTGSGAPVGVPAPLAQVSTFVRTGWILLRILGAVVTVPLAEELAFRGFLLRRLASANFEAVAWRTFQWSPFVISSIAFGILHGERWLAGTLAGMIYALVLMRRGRIGEAVIAHATTNALLAAWVLATGQWQLW
jgi:exosortase E/protease (VPEID-CTERM system)